MTPTYALNLVVNQLVDEETLAVVQLRQHRCSFDDDRLHGKNSEQDKDDDDQKNISNKSQAFGPDPLTRFAAKLHDVDIPVVIRRDGSELELVFPAEIEHNRLFDEQR